MTEINTPEKKDWVGNYRGFIVVWGLPIAAMIGAKFVEPTPKTVVWIAALVWMGAACLANAKRCGRTHCYFTGPFFLVMTVPVLLHGFEIVPLGPEGWKWLGIAIAVGGGGLWCLTERFWGKFPPWAPGRENE